jgi:hypothetical protein
MAGSRTATAAVGLLAGLALSVALWWYFDTLAVFLLVPFVPFLFRRSGEGVGRGVGPEPPTDPDPIRECPTCGFRTREDDYDYCPKDGRRLQ